MMFDGTYNNNHSKIFLPSSSSITGQSSTTCHDNNNNLKDLNNTVLEFNISKERRNLYKRYAS